MTPERWIAAVPLLLLPCCWLWWWAGGLNPGLETGRSAALLLLAGCAVAVWRLRADAAVPRPALPLLLALAWSALTLAWAPVREPGLVWLAERAAAAAAATGLALWAAARPAAAVAGAVAVAGLGVLALTCLTQYGDLGAILRTNREAPFGNVNFGVGAALPLAAVGVALFIAGGGRWWGFALAAGAAAGLLAGGTLGGDPCHAAWLGGGAAVAAALALRLPPRLHAPLLAAGGLGLAAGWGAVAAGLLDVSAFGAGSAFRMHLWPAAFQALAGPSAAVGHGIGAAIAVLPEQQSFAAAWLSVPSYAAHAHAEPLQALLDGGLVLAALLGWALWATLRPLWRRRGEPACAALLVGWATAAALALVESHLSQPGGLLCLALLAGASWAVAGERAALPRAGLRLAAPLLAAGALALLLARELAADGGGPVSVEERALRRLDGDPARDLAVLDELRARLGPLADLDLRRARLLGRLGRGADAGAALAAHLRRVPADAEALRLAARLRAAGAAPPALLAAEAQARARAPALLAAVRRNGSNGAALDALRRELSPAAGGDPAPAR